MRGECFFWYWLTRVVPDKGPQNGSSSSMQLGQLITTGIY